MATPVACVMQAPAATDASDDRRLRSKRRAARKWPKKDFQLRPTPGFGGDPSAAARALIARLNKKDLGPVLSLRTSLPQCKGPDLHALFNALEGSMDVHFISFGCNNALANSRSLGLQLARVLQSGFIWACDFGELYFRWNVFDAILSSLEETSTRALTSNLAFTFADEGCGVDKAHIAKLKRLTRQRRLLDKALSPDKVDRTHAPWLDIPRVFGMVVRSKNLTKCFWRPYQEAEWWRRAGFHCSGAQVAIQNPGKCVNPSIRRLATALHRGNLEPAALQKAFPPGPEGERQSHALWKASLSRKLPPAPLPRWALPGLKVPRREVLQPVLREGLLKRRRHEMSHDGQCQEMLVID
ncbi:unnamed protein product [Effrenium voratum]|nr:unnamed protein product [Effrenium voratum]